jgi:hypothetical protein
MKIVIDDGGRAAAGFKGSAGDCVCRAIAIASGRHYKEVYDRIAEGMATQRNDPPRLATGAAFPMRLPRPPMRLAPEGHYPTGQLEITHEWRPPAPKFQW